MRTISVHAFDLESRKATCFSSDILEDAGHGRIHLGDYTLDSDTLASVRRYQYNLVTASKYKYLDEACSIRVRGHGPDSLLRALPNCRSGYFLST
jgi:hypothetical protein